jgi:hypothetical protein
MIKAILLERGDLMIIEFDTEEEEVAFLKYATSNEKTDSAPFENLREKLKNHKRAKERGMGQK